LKEESPSIRGKQKRQSQADPTFSANPVVLQFFPTFYVLHLLLEVFPETLGVVILPGVAGPEIAEPVVDVVAAVVV